MRRVTQVCLIHPTVEVIALTVASKMEKLVLRLQVMAKRQRKMLQAKLPKMGHQLHPRNPSPKHRRIPIRNQSQAH